MQKHITATALVLCCCVLFFVPVVGWAVDPVTVGNTKVSNPPPSVVESRGLINTSGCEVPGADTTGNCRNIEILLIQAISLIEYLFGIIGTLAFAMFVYGGLKMILAFGSEDKFKEGKEAMVNAVIGMIIAFSAYILVNFVLDVLGVKEDFRAVGTSSSSLSSVEGTLSACQTNDDCNVGVTGGQGQHVCAEGMCINPCGGQYNGTCGAFNLNTCTAPRALIPAAACPGDSTKWKCCGTPLPVETINTPLP